MAEDLVNSFYDGTRRRAADSVSSAGGSYPRR